MAPATNPNVWLVADLPTATNASYNKKRATLYDDAESGEWDNIYKTLAYAQKAYDESWVNYIVSDGGWTLLHYAAYEGGPDPVNKLIKLGAWRSIKTTHTEGTPLSESEMTPYEIAKEGGHTEILASLRPRFKLKTSDAVIEELEAQLYDLICTEMEWNEDSVELPALGVLRESGADGWFPVRPGVNSEIKGYYYRLSGSELLVWSCDSDGGIEVQRHVSQGSYREVDEGETIYTTDPFSASTTVYTSSRGVYTSSAYATSKSMSTTTTTTTTFVDNDDGTVTTVVDDDVIVRSDDDDDVILVQDPSDDDDNPGSDAVDDDGSDVPSDDPDDDPDGDPSDDPSNSDPEPDHDGSDPEPDHDGSDPEPDHDGSDPEPDHDGSDPEPDLVDPDDDDIPAHHQHGHSDAGGSDDD